MIKLTNIIVHCSDSTFGDASLIDGWHREKGWKGIGYHYVILNGRRKLKEEYKPEFDGLIEPGRTLDNDLWIEENEIGSHALGFNKNSLGLCLIGGFQGKKDFFTPKQYLSGLLLCAFYSRLIPGIKILGHNETGAEKACPVIDMDLFRDRVSRLTCRTELDLVDDIAKRNI